MKKILIFTAFCAIFVHACPAAVRDGDAVSRQKSSGTVGQRRVNTTPRGTSRVASRGTVVIPSAGRDTTDSSISSRISVGTTRGTVAQDTTSSRSATSSVVGRTSVPARRTPENQTLAARSTVARAGTDTDATVQTRTGAEYEQCKTAFFTCMDQFCQLKNDEYRRCSCSDRVISLGNARDTLQDAGEKLTVFTENLDVVGMTAAQAAAMRTESEGESALTSDSSASKALLQAIMNSIRGQDSNVGGKFSNLNSIDLSFDTGGMFGNIGAGQAIAKYNGQNLYSAVYPQCRGAVRDSCNDAALQRAITAYQMAIEQDCNTVQTAIEKKQKEMKSAVREGSAMLDLARVENRKNHNSSDFTTCLNAVEAAIQSEEVCGAGYHKCLDNGEFIDVATGAPITGVSNFAELAKMLTFSDGVEAANQQLSKVNSNRVFVSNFEKRTKKFASPALDKCREIADDVWGQYLDKALLDIYYAQQSKVDEIKQGCFDFVSSCYMNGDQSLTEAMKELIGNSSILVQPDKIVLNAEMCTDYVESCNNLFANNGVGDIVSEYVNNMKNTDTITACRAVAKQCFDKFGGTGYLNFYYPYSGLAQSGTGTMPDWFSLYDVRELKDGESTCNNDEISVGEKLCRKSGYVSECAKMLTRVTACNDPELIETVFGGLDRLEDEYGLYYVGSNRFEERFLRPIGVATEVYNQIVDILQTQCMGLQGKFVQYQNVDKEVYNPANFCLFRKFGKYETLEVPYRLFVNEDVCPRDYGLQVDTQSWGTCNCWENGARRSKWGTTAKCMTVIPTAVSNAGDTECATQEERPKTLNKNQSGNWCVVPYLSDLGQVCPYGTTTDENQKKCKDSANSELQGIPEMSKNM